MQVDTSGSESEAVELPSELSRLSSLLDQKPESFASGDKEIEEAALAAAKYIFDLTLKSEQGSIEHIKELLDTLNPREAPRTRSQRAAESHGLASSSKHPASHAITQPTPLSSLLVEGMEDEQIWAQLELKASNVCMTLEESFNAGPVDARGAFLDSGDDEEESPQADEDSEDEIDGLDGFNWAHDESDSSDEDEEEEEEEDDDDDEEASASSSDLGESVEALKDPSSDESEMDLDALPAKRATRGRPRSRHAELDDDFFNLADFNAEIEEAESKRVTRGVLGDEEDEDEEEEYIDLFAPVDETEGDDELVAEDEAFYGDFFTPPSKIANPRKRKATHPAQAPPRKPLVRFNEQVKVKSIKATGKGRALYDDDDDDDDDDNDVDRDATEDDDKYAAMLGEESSEDELENASIENGRDAVARLKDDLFADDEEGKNDTDLTSHEKRMRDLREQIRELEQENVGVKDWVMRGEVSSKARPQNSLLEEDLDFERITKPVPIVTDEVVQDLESRIKARILEERFDDVVRKRAVDDKPFLPSKVFELQDTKSKESLSQIYEKEYMSEKNGGTVDDRDGRLMKEHKELEQMWEGICYKLDALCNAHFTPKQPTATISTISNVSAVSLESALPTAQASNTVLAPEEVFSANASDLVSRQELTPARKQALRTKERKKRKKQRDAMERSVDKFAKVKNAKGTRQQKDAALKSLVKNGKGVTIIGKESRKDKTK